MSHSLYLFLFFFFFFFNDTATTEIYTLSLHDALPISDLRPEAVPEPLRKASAGFRTALADELQTLSARVIDHDVRPNHDLQDALVELERVSASHIGTIASAD